MDNLELKIRKAQSSDGKNILEIRNDPEVLKFSFDTSPVSYESHIKWFENILTQKNRPLYVITSVEEIVAVVRYDYDNDIKCATASIYVKSSHWGKGIGSFALRGCEKIFLDEFVDCKRLSAKIFIENKSSIKLFEKCNYKPRYLNLFKEVL